MTWVWVQPKTKGELLTRLAEARDLSVPERERENLCAVAYTYIRNMPEPLDSNVDTRLPAGELDPRN